MTKIIFVLGMHRSGTSAIAGMLHAGGISMGDKLFGKTAANLIGHFENKVVMAINKDVFTKCNSDWDSPPDCPTDFPNMPDILKRMERLCEQYSERYSVWGMKDPRLCITFPLWYDIITKMASNKIYIIFITRDSLAVANSLLQRNKKSIVDGVMLFRKYLRHVKSNLANHNVEKVLHLTYKDVLKDSYKTQKSIEDAFEIDLKEGYKIIDPKLEHHK